MNPGWSVKPLGRVARIISGATPSTDVSNYWDGNIRWATPRDLSQLERKFLAEPARRITEEGLASCSAEILPPGSVLFTSRAPIGLTAIAETPMATNQGFKSFIPNPEELDSGYLYHWLRANRSALENLGNGATFKEVSKAVVARVEIPLPPLLADQKRIAAILDKADEIRLSCQEVLRLSDAFLRAVFLDLFGDPITNPKGWPMKPLSEGVASFEGGRNLMPTDVERSDRIRVLKVSAVTSGEYRSDESKSFEADEEVHPDHIVRAGDLLISRANTADLVGAVAYVWDTDGREMLPDKLWRFVWSNPQRIDPLFMLHMARSSYFRQQLFQRATGTSGSMKNIGKYKMLEIPIPFPPIELQEKFAKIARKAQNSIHRGRQACDESGILFSGLQHRAFRGEI